MSKEMLINVSEGEECRIALVEDGKLEELYMERTSSTSHVGNIYKGKVTNVEPSIQAAFVDFGLGRNGFLHISDLMPHYFGRKGDEYGSEAVGRKISRRDRPPIQRCLRRGDEINVQIIKEGIGTKGPTLTTYLSVPGRVLVMMPGMSKFGISRKIEDEEERRRLRQILDSLKPIDDVGFIIRTAGVGKTKTEIERDLKYLTRLWDSIKKKMKEPAPQELYTEGDLVTRTVRDVYSSEVSRLVCDNKEVAKKIREFFKIAMPRTKNKVELYDEPIPLFHKYSIEPEIEKMYSRHVPLPSGGSLVIDSTEAIVAIDVNSGKFRDHSDAETTAFKTDMEAADEIPRQLRLRDLGGVIICDFIDLRFERHRRELERKLHDNLKKDRAKTKVLRMSQFGIIEMTRQRMRPSLKRSIYFDCPHCKGSGLVKTPESMSLDVMRKLAIAINDQRVTRVELTVCPDVAMFLLNRKRAQLSELEGEAKKRVLIRHDPLLGLDEMRLSLFDTRDGLVYLETLGMTPADGGIPVHGRGRHDSRRGGRGDQRRDSRQQGRRQQQRRTDSRDEERFDDEGGEEAVEQRELDRVEISAAASTEPLPTAVEIEEPESENVVDVDDAAEPMGEHPGAIDEPGDRRGNGRRRRGRRGGRGRNRGNGGPPRRDREAPTREEEPRGAEREPQSVAAQDEPVDADVAGEEPDEPSPGNELSPPATAEGDQPRRKRRRRGGRRHRRRRERAAAAAAAGGDAGAEGEEPNGNVREPEPVEEVEEDDDAEVEDRLTARPAVERPTPQRTPPPRAIEPPAPVVRTGSTDKHLIRSEQPVEPEPPRRPRNYRDLDAIPDDQD